MPDTDILAKSAPSSPDGASVHAHLPFLRGCRKVSDLGVGHRGDANRDILVSAWDRLIPDTPELSVPASRARP
jgi:hypothetical protein